MSALLEEVLKLIASSQALTDQPEERWFWELQAKVTDDEKLEKLKAVLEYEQKEAARIQNEHMARAEKIDRAHLAELETFKRAGLPKFLKKWEAAQTSKENPENILKQI